MSDFLLNFEGIYTLDTGNIEIYKDVGQEIKFDVLKRFEEEGNEIPL